MKKNIIYFALVLFVSFVSGVITVCGFALGDFQAVLYAAVLEMCGLFLICISADSIIQQIEDIQEM